MREIHVCSSRYMLVDHTTNESAPPGGDKYFSMQELIILCPLKALHGILL